MVIEIREIGADFWAIGAFPLGVALDLILGAPGGWPHPVRAIGWSIRRVERSVRGALARYQGGPRAEVFAGAVLALVVVTLTMYPVWLLIELSGQLGGPASLLVRALLIYWGLAIRSLGDETLRVLEAADLET